MPHHGTPITSLILALAVLSGCATGPDSPASGACPVDYAALKAEESDLIARGMAVFRDVEEADYTDPQRRLIEQTFTLLQSRQRPVDEFDIEIIDRAGDILSDETVWDRDDDRVCEPEDQTYSLFCALRLASQQIIGEYDHRRTGLQEVRFALQDATRGKEYEHRLRDFNNDPETTLEEIRSVLATARAVVRQRLADQAECRLQPTLD